MGTERQRTVGCNPATLALKKRHLALPRRDQNHTVGAADAEAAVARSVLQDVDALDLVGVDVVVGLALDTVDHNQRAPRPLVFNFSNTARKSALSLPDSPEVCSACGPEVRPTRHYSPATRARMSSSLEADTNAPVTVALRWVP